MITVLALVVTNALGSTGILSVALSVIASLCACGAPLLAGHIFRVRLAIRQQEWRAGDPTLVLREDIADVFDVPDALTEPGPDPVVAWRDHVIVPHAQFLARDITDTMQRKGILPMGTSFRWSDADGSLNDDVLDGQPFDEEPT